MKRAVVRIISGGIAILASGFALNASACTAAAWDSVSGSGVTASPGLVARYSEFCAYEIAGTGHVQSNKASDQRYIARFYVLDGLGGTGDVEIFQAFSDDGATTPLFKISLDGAQFTFDAGDAGGGQATAASKNGWNLVEIDWDSGSNTFDYWVNANAAADTATGSINPGVGTVEAVRLGAPNGIAPQTGKLTFDAFESHRSTPVGVLLAGDANNDGSINILDLGIVRIELLNPGNVNLLAPGQPDCNSDGSINILDVGCVRLVLLN